MLVHLHTTLSFTYFTRLIHMLPSQFSPEALGPKNVSHLIPSFLVKLESILELPKNSINFEYVF